VITTIRGRSILFVARLALGLTVYDICQGALGASIAGVEKLAFWKHGQIKFKALTFIYTSV
jgi:hypothetical protein